MIDQRCGKQCTFTGLLLIYERQETELSALANEG